jgi:hypothetical protein
MVCLWTHRSVAQAGEVRGEGGGPSEKEKKAGQAWVSGTHFLPGIWQFHVSRSVSSLGSFAGVATNPNGWSCAVEHTR